MFEYLDSFRDQRTRGCFRDILRRGAVHREKKIYIYIVLLRNMRGMLSKMKKNRGKWKKFVVYSRDIPEVLLKKRREPSLASK